MRTLLIFGVCAFVLATLVGGTVARYRWDKANIHVAARVYPDPVAVANCYPNSAVMLAIDNRSTQSLDQIEMTVTATESGGSRDFLINGQVKAAVAVEPRQEDYVCYTFALQPGAPTDLVYRVSQFDVTFR